MTPELRTACEVVFQEHKLSAQPIKWNRDSFKGRISIGLSEMAKQTLVEKHIIILPDKSKKIFTQLNPDVVSANSFEQAEMMIETHVSTTEPAPSYDAENYITEHVYGFPAKPVSAFSGNKSTSFGPTAAIKMDRTKWWLKPVFLYLVWPVLGAAAGIMIARLMDLAYSDLFVSIK